MQRWSCEPYQCWLSWSDPPSGQADYGLLQQLCLTPLHPPRTPSPMMSSPPAYTDLRMYFWRGKHPPKNPPKGFVPSQYTWFFSSLMWTALSIWSWGVCLSFLHPVDISAFDIIYLLLSTELPQSDFWMVINCFQQKAFQ